MDAPLPPLAPRDQVHPAPQPREPCRDDSDLFHSVYGLRPFERGVAERLTVAGHECFTPDLYEGRVASSMEEGFALKEEIGWSTLCERAERAVRGFCCRAFWRFFHGALLSPPACGRSGPRRPEFSFCTASPKFRQMHVAGCRCRSISPTRISSSLQTRSPPGVLMPNGRRWHWKSSYIPVPGIFIPTPRLPITTPRRPGSPGAASNVALQHFERTLEVCPSPGYRHFLPAGGEKGASRTFLDPLSVITGREGRSVKL